MISGRDLLERLNADDIKALIDAARIKGALDDRVAMVTSIMKREEVSKTRDIKKIVKVTLIVMAVVACVCGIAYALYKFFTPDYDDDFDDEFDDFDDDFDDAFDDEDDDDKKTEKEEKEQDKDK